MNGKFNRFCIFVMGVTFGLASPVMVSSQQKDVRANAEIVAQSELENERVAAEPNDLPSIKTVDKKTGATFRVYFDEASAAVAEKSIPMLAAFYRQLADSSAVDGGRVKWHSLVFTSQADYVQPRREGDVRWIVVTDKNGLLTEHGMIDLYLVVPHEQAHAIQAAFVPQHTARWFKEGQATWLGMKVTERWNAELARKERETLRSEQKKAVEPLALRKWGSVRVRGDAVMRQMTPEEREKMKQNPNSVMSGSFTFSKDDLVSDESNAKARYGAAFDIFEEVERKSSPEQLNAWLESIWEQKTELLTDVLIRLTLEKTGVDIAERLK